MSTTETTSIEFCPPLTADQWNQLLTRVVAPELGQNLRRQTRRYPVTGEAKIVFEKGGKIHKRSFDVLNVSRGGLTIKGYDEVKPDTIIELKIVLGAHSAPLKAKVVHCTGTLGGFKIGVKILFDK